MAEARWDPRIAVFVPREPEAGPFAEARRAAPQVDGHVVELAGEHADQLALRPAELIVQAADGVLHRARAVLLHEPHVAADGFAENSLVIALVGDAARVLVDLRLEQQHFGELGRNDLHR